LLDATRKGGIFVLVQQSYQKKKYYLCCVEMLFQRLLKSLPVQLGWLFSFIALWWCEKYSFKIRGAMVVRLPQNKNASV